MINKNSNLIENPLKTKKDLQKAFLDLTEPLKKYYSPGSALLPLGMTGATYTHEIAFLEGFARVLWGFGPFLSGGGCDNALYEIYLEGIKNGTNPKHPEYWGDFSTYSQHLVEMAPIGFALALAPDKLWNPLSEEEKDNFANWLNKINQFEPYNNNWLFFRAMVDLGLNAVGKQYDKELLSKTLARLEEFYKGDGWYSDGNTAQYDYYISFAMHFYGLIYGKFTGETKYLERAEVFAKDFIYWFSKEGDSIPFGRSLTYKFAQVAFFSAYVYAGGSDTGLAKGIILRHLRWWFQNPIFDRDGILAMGYCYPNLIMTEGYNAPGSQYWALKSFLILALPDTHPFWTAEEKPLPDLKPVSVQRHPKMMIQRIEDGKNIIALTSGQYAAAKPTGVDAKYSKFAYSNVFGFSISRATFDLCKGAFDSALALSEDGRDYRVRTTCTDVLIREEAIYSTWQPWDDVLIKTILVPVGAYHIRIHKIKTKRKLIAEECGFSTKTAEQYETLEAADSICALYPWNCTGIADLSGERKAYMQPTDANTNIIYPRASMPVLSCEIAPGEKILACAVLGVIDAGYCKELWQLKPTLDSDLNIKYNGVTIKLLDY